MSSFRDIVDDKMGKMISDANEVCSIDFVSPSIDGMSIDPNLALDVSEASCEDEEGVGDLGDSIGDNTPDEENNDVGKPEEIAIAKNETKQVVRLRISLILVLVSSAILVGCGSFYLARESEISKFQENFNQDATKVLQSIGAGVINTFAGLDSFATNFVSHAKAINATFPYVNIPEYANRVSKLQSMSVGLTTWTFIIVQPGQRKEYEEWAWKTKRSIVNETLKVQATDPNYYGAPLESVAFSRSFVDDYNPLPYNVTHKFCVLSQQYPITAFDFPAFNWDWFSTTDNEYFLRTMEYGQPVLGVPYILPDPNNPDEVENAEYWGNLYAALEPPGENPFEPASDMNYPVYTNLSRIHYEEPGGYNASDIVGIVTSTFYWRDLFKNILPAGRKGIDVNVENPCTASFTYRINGENVTYLGRGDHHETKFTNLGIHSNFFDLKKYSSVQSKYTGIPLDEEFCPFVINVYPSIEMQQQYLTNNPIIFAMIAVLIFAFTSLVFFVYDCKVENRQKLVLSTAIRSNAVVSSLFPSAVREKILDDTKTKIDTDKQKDAKGVRDIKSFLQRRGGNDYTDEASFDGLVDITTSPPIADLYPETTVFFADIAGFTKWSSSRSPNQVFRMLETLYGSFDKIARAYRIFKVETIGDSYVAVAGLPDPMKNHATVMVRFSIKVLAKTSEVMHALSHELGPETVELNLRVGLNSGPTTAGVLRGEKSRFQLFGDTVNTAARMESNGSPGRIHVSQSTADCLTQGGKGMWLRKRDDLIVAKGKGTMQTYWIHVTASSGTNSYRSVSSDPTKGMDANSRHERSLDGYSIHSKGTQLTHAQSIEAHPDSLQEKHLEAESRHEI